MGGLARFEANQWKKFWKYWEDFIAEWPEAKRIALKAAGNAILEEVQRSIVKEGINDSRGRVRRWQDMRVGSGGGYVAISPVDDAVQITQSGKVSTARDITRYLNRGHGVREPSDPDSKKYKKRVQENMPISNRGKVYVPGRPFYSDPKRNSGEIARKAADDALSRLSDAIDDAVYGS